ncbi:Kri1-like protein [Thalictrum thalictroides]|uniref:Kri1-like protein n=1 Tax=Thalictrum thalictroides TaxID=46969 RepID=A0A7J6W445_THATH|nr:Kri1-like protein [Thalictrum thalictroides]
MKLFDETDDIEDISKIETNQEFAKRFEHNKKREELQRLEELKKKGYIDDSDEDSEESEESDDDVEALASGKNIVELFNVLTKVKNKDPILNQKDVKLFESSSDEEEEEEEKTEKKKKAMYLKDVVAKQLIEDGPELEEDEEKEEKSRVKSYYEEQDEYRKALLDATEGVFEEEDGDFLKEKKRDGEDEGDETDEEQKKIGEFFGPDENLDENDMFLKNFWTNKLYMNNDKGKKPFNADLEVLSEDDDEVEKQEMYEASYNYRFEEGAGDQVLGHARITEGSVRKKDNTRKKQRERKEQRIVEAERQRKEELKHMKNLKKKEIQEKLQKIRAIAGIAEGSACPLNADDLEEEFDPEEYDRRMKETFDVDYYDAEEVDPGFGSDAEDLQKPDFDKEDELLGLPKDWDVCGGSADGFSAARENNLKRKAEMKDDDISTDSAEIEEELPEESKRKKKRKLSLKEKMALDKELEEYYKLDYEGTIGDLKTRFKYTSVPPQRYGLTPEEMLTTDEKELNQYVSLKKLAPYREKEWKVPNSKRQAQKLKNKSPHVEVNSKDRKSDNMHKQKDDDNSTVETASTHQGESQLNESNGELGTMSRRSKRRRRQADLKLSHNRLMAYGKITAPSKKKKKH